MEKENKIMKLGFIGTGNMAGAIMGGIIRNEIFKPEAKCNLHMGSMLQRIIRKRRQNHKFLYSL